MPLRDTLNRPIRDLRISVIDNCNMRCTYCMPKETYGERYKFLSSGELLSFEEIERLSRLFVQLGVTKLRLTGGEPLLRKDLPDLIARMATIEGVDDLALTTNGILLPKLARDLRAAGLERLTVSLDSLDEDVFKEMNGRDIHPDAVLAGIDAAIDAGFADIKLNCVVQRGVNDQTLLDLVEYCRERGIIVRFIEYMDVGNRNGWRLDHVVPSREILAQIDAVYPVEPLSKNYHGEVAERYAFKDGVGEIGFISSVTETFCGSCTRARLAADGVFYTCLFASDGTDLRRYIRSGASDDDLLDVLRGVWSRRADRYSDLRASMTDYGTAIPKVEMYRIGG